MTLLIRILDNLKPLLDTTEEWKETESTSRFTGKKKKELSGSVFFLS